MGSVKRVKGQAQRAKRKSVPPASAGGLKSDLGKKMWAVLHDDGPTGNLTHEEAKDLAAKTGGYVTTNNAILNCD
jgi:hypothetical protein